MDEETSAWKSYDDLDLAAFSADRGNACLMGRLHPSLIITVNELREVPHVCWYNLNIWTPQFILAVCFNSPLHRIIFWSSKREEKIWPISYQLFSQDLPTKLWPNHTLNSEYNQNIAVFYILKFIIDLFLTEKVETKYLLKLFTKWCYILLMSC